VPPEKAPIRPYKKNAAVKTKTPTPVPCLCLAVLHASYIAVFTDWLDETHGVAGGVTLDLLLNPWQWQWQHHLEVHRV
jgi:hypothetical protein